MSASPALMPLAPWTLLVSVTIRRVNTQLLTPVTPAMGELHIKDAVQIYAV